MIIKFTINIVIRIEFVNGICIEDGKFRLENVKIEATLSIGFPGLPMTA
jgi:hypothetical protein